MIEVGQTFDESLAQGDQSPRLRELILYIADKCRHEPSFGKTSLNKILYFADFMHFAGSGESITGVRYVRRQMGPVPEWHALRVAFDELQSGGRLDIADVDYFGWPQKKPVALGKPDVSCFSEKQLNLVDRVAELVCKFSATEISDITHEDLGWKFAVDGEVIPYETVWLRRKVCMSQKAILHAKERATRALSFTDDAKPNN